ncbi:MAG: nuclear transport factor 2 family protein [Actinomycetota bacterium]|nr:nuclear transport factor 2 family protein [Actinomycetota bacterium]
MSASENKAAIQAAYQAFGAGDLEGTMQNMADDVEWIVPGNSTISGTYRGKDEVAHFFATLASKSFRTEP